VIRKVELNEPNKEILSKLRIRTSRPSLADSQRTTKPASSFAESPTTHPNPVINSRTEPRRINDSKQNSLQLLAKLNDVKDTAPYEGVRRGDPSVIKKLNINTFIFRSPTAIQFNPLFANFVIEASTIILEHCSLLYLCRD